MRALFFLILLTACTHLHAQQTFCTDSLVQDFRYFVEQLEQTHPDPYTRFGGKALFHKAVETCEMQMRSDSISTSKQLAACINNSSPLFTMGIPASLILALIRSKTMRCFVLPSSSKCWKTD